MDVPFEWVVIGFAVLAVAGWQLRKRFGRQGLEIKKGDGSTEL